jgi:hypothetical protein
MFIIKHTSNMLVYKNTKKNLEALGKVFNIVSD